MLEPAQAGDPLGYRPREPVVAQVQRAEVVTLVDGLGDLAEESGVRQGELLEVLELTDPRRKLTLDARVTREREPLQRFHADPRLGDLAGELVLHLQPFFAQVEHLERLHLAHLLGKSAVEPVGAQVEVAEVLQAAEFLAQLASHAVGGQRERLQLGHGEELVGDLSGEEVIGHVQVQQLVQLRESRQVELAPARHVVQVHVELRDPPAGAHDAVPVVRARLAHAPVALHAPPNPVALIVELLQRALIRARGDQGVALIRRGGHDHRGTVRREPPRPGLGPSHAHPAAPRVPPGVAPSERLSRLRVHVRPRLFS